MLHILPIPGKSRDFDEDDLKDAITEAKKERKAIKKQEKDASKNVLDGQDGAGPQNQYAQSVRKSMIAVEAGLYDKPIVVKKGPSTLPVLRGDHGGAAEEEDDDRPHSTKTTASLSAATLLPVATGFFTDHDFSLVDLPTIFDVLDEDGEGAIDQQEFVRALAKYDYNRPNKDLLYFFLDQDGDDITREEFMWCPGINMYLCGNGTRRQGVWGGGWKW